jgi:hypothetical protein
MHAYFHINTKADDTRAGHPMRAHARLLSMCMRPQDCHDDVTATRRAYMHAAIVLAKIEVSMCVYARGYIANIRLT